jgi:type II secretion system protein G
MKKTKSITQLGFTLIELLVVITVIGILTTLAVTNFSSARSRARDLKRKSDLRNAKAALRLYYNDFQTYPAASSGRIAGCGSGGTTACSWGSAFTAVSTYMNQLPQDPLNTGSYVYTYAQTSSGEGFTITAVLENASDADSTTSQTRCGVTPVANNYVICQD